MANDLTFNQLSTVLADIVEQATGQKALAPINTTSFISVAKKGLEAGYDPLSTAISQVLSRTIFSVRPYTRKFRGLNVSNQRYGNHVRKLLTIDKPFEDDDRLKLVDGESIDQYKVNKPKVLQTNFYGANVYQKSVTIYKDQLDCAFSSPDEFASFISMVMQNSSDMIEQAHEETARATIGNLIGGIFAMETENSAETGLAKANGGRRAVNLLALYNQESGKALKVADVYKAENFEGFVKFTFSIINTIADSMTDRSTLFSSQLTDYPILRHTPKDRMKFYLYTELVNKINSEVYSSVFNPDFLKLVDFETVNYWQSSISPTAISTNCTVLKQDGSLIGMSENIYHILGVLFDEEAAGYTTVNEWSQPSPFNARGGYYNQFWHFTDRYWNDFTENAVIFYIKDLPGDASSLSNSTVDTKKEKVSLKS